MVRNVVARCLGERAIPVGGVARDRQLLRRALAGQAVGRVLVVGPGLAVRQALPDVPIDVAGTSPHSAEVTVCSAARGGGSLPLERWDTVIIMESGTELPEQLDAVRPACRAAARLLIVERPGVDVNGSLAAALANVAAIRQVLGKRQRRLWVAEVRA